MKTSLIALAAVLLTGCWPLPVTKEQREFWESSRAYWKKQYADYKAEAEDTTKPQSERLYAFYMMERSSDHLAEVNSHIAGTYDYSAGYAAPVAGYSGNTYGTPPPSLYVTPGPGTRVMNYGGGMWSGSGRTATGGYYNCYGAYGGVTCQ